MSAPDGMWYASTEVFGWRVETWEQASGPDRASQDAKLVWPCGDRLRVAAIDGVTPSANTPERLGVDGAMWAVAVLRLALQNPNATLTEAVLAANAELYDPTVTCSRDQTQACVMACDIFTDGRVELVRAGDCEAWVGQPSEARALFPDHMLRPDTQAELEAWHAANPLAPKDERDGIEETLLGDPGRWNSSAVGRFEQPVLQRATVQAPACLTLASDGASLHTESFLDLEGWLAGLRERERAAAVPGSTRKVHDDVTVLRLRPATGR